MTAIGTDRSDDAFIAATRFGLGARPGELQRVRSDPRTWLSAQTVGNRDVPAPIAELPTSRDVFTRYFAAQEARRDARAADKSGEQGGRAAQPPAATMRADEAEQAQKIIQGVRQVLAPIYLDQVAARYRVAVTSDEPLRERLVHFWTNHFAVSADKVAVIGLAGTLENEVIRPQVSARFVDMLLAVEAHPAMILYLDNQQSAGPNSQLAQLAARRRNAEARHIGINENLAREILELHTLGVSGGYTQADVTTFAKALTGWSVGGGRGRLAQGSPGEFVFREAMHEPGAKAILGKRYTAEGRAQAIAVLNDLAAHPATANHIAAKLVRHFVSDDPPPAAVDKVAKAFRDSDGHLPTVHRAVIDCREAWQTPFSKYKTPHEFVVSALRMLNVVPPEKRAIAAPFDLLGQRPYTPGSPAGWSDTASHWDGPDALMKRIEWSAGLAQRMANVVAPSKLADETLGTVLSDHTRTAIARAASGAQALTLLLMSPEFQRR